jgi:hypothetical protein
MTIQVINKYHQQKVQIGDRVIGIMRGTALGNPYRISGKIDRMESLKKYRVWLFERIKSGDSAVLKALFEIKTLNDSGYRVKLECCCSPKKCHGEIIIRAIQWMDSTDGWGPRYGLLRHAMSFKFKS